VGGAARQPDSVAMPRPSPDISWIVRYVDKDGVFRLRTFQAEAAAVAFMRSVHQTGLDVRSWAEVWTHERALPADLRKP
jgi:hypothetical protein